MSFRYTFTGTEVLSFPGSIFAADAINEPALANFIDKFITPLENGQNVPEPSALLLLGLGLLMLGLVERKRVRMFLGLGGMSLES